MRALQKIFSDSLSKAELWIVELARIGRLATPGQAYSTLHAVLHTLRDALTTDEAAQLGAQLPLMIRGIYYEGWKPASAPRRLRTTQAFLALVKKRLGNTDINPADACRFVFSLLERHISSGEIEDVRNMMHTRIRSLWPDPLIPSSSRYSNSRQNHVSSSRSRSNVRIER